MSRLERNYAVGIINHIKKTNIATALEHIGTEIYMLYFSAIKEEHERQHSNQHHQAINALFAKRLIKRPTS